MGEELAMSGASRADAEGTLGGCRGADEVAMSGASCVNSEDELSCTFGAGYRRMKYE